MATRFRLRKDAAPEVAPAISGASWPTSSGIQRLMDVATLGGDTPADDAAVGSPAGNFALHRQYTSKKLAAGNVFVAGSTSFKAQIQCFEAATNDNIFSACQIKVVSSDGATIRKQVVTRRTMATHNNEWNPTTARNKNFADFAVDVAQGYTTVAGDRLVVEFGHIDNVGSTISGTTRWGSDGTDLPEDETDTDTSKIPWFEVSLDLVFLDPQTEAVDQAAETDTAGVVTPFQGLIPVLQASETDTAQALTALKRVAIAQAAELDRAKQIAVVGGLLPVSEFPVLIRAPVRAGRTFVEVTFDGDSYHPNVAQPQAEEEAPGGFGPFTGRVSERIYRAHRDVFRAGAKLYWWHEDGTCIHAGTLLEPDTSDGEVQLTDRGFASKADREVGPILYQRTVGTEVMPFGGHPRWWSVRTDLGNQSAAMVVFERERSTSDTDGGAWAIIPFFGRELAHMRFQVTGARAFIEVYVARKGTVPRTVRPGDIDLLDLSPVWIANFNPTTSLFTAQIELDLTLQEDDTSLPQTGTDNYDNTEISFVYPDCIVINVGDDAPGTDDTSVELVDIEVNGAAVGERRTFSAHDLVEDIAALLGIKTIQVEGGGVDILPYELPPGMSASEALDYASLLTGLRWRILHNGNRATLEFGPWTEHQWGLASPWSPFDAIPQERFDAVSVPFRYPGTELDDNIVVRIKDSPLERRSVYHGLSLADPAHNQDKAINLAGHLVEELVRKRNAGSFAAAELIGSDGLAHTAHHANAGDVLLPMRSHDRGRLRISHLTRFEDHIEGTFDGENHALDKMLARREKRMSRR